MKTKSARLAGKEQSIMADSQSSVEYRDIPGFPGYRVGSDGTVWSRKARGGNDRRPGRLRDGWRELSQSLTTAGYSRVNLFKGGVNYAVLVGWLVLEAFVGPCPEGMEMCHAPDNTRSNNRLDNLRWDTKKANSEDRRAAGTVPDQRGEKNHKSKLTEQDVLQVIDMRRSGKPYREIASTFGVTSEAIIAICTGKSWTHITGGKRVPRFYANRGGA